MGKIPRRAHPGCKTACLNDLQKTTETRSNREPVYFPLFALPMTRDRVFPCFLEYRDGLMRTFRRKRSLASHGTSHDCKRPVVCAEALGLTYLFSSGLVLFASSRYRRRAFISVNQWIPMSTVRLISSSLHLQIF